MEKPSTSAPGPVIHPQREAFEHGLLPIPKLIFPDPTQTLAQLRQKLGVERVGPTALGEALQISADHAWLILDTLASVLYTGSEIEDADPQDLLMFLYIQSYKKLIPRSHKDSAAVADVWPSTSAFDHHLSALSPLQVQSSASSTSSLTVPSPLRGGDDARVPPRGR